jgi:hypothetical protein
MISIIFDIVYAILDVRVWYKVDEYQPIWQTIYPMHAFATGTFLLEFALKIITLILLFVLKGRFAK